MVAAGPSRGQVVALLSLAGLLVVVGIRADAGGALLALPGAAVLLAIALRDLLLSPVLTADSGGLSVVTGTRRRRVGWDQVEGIRLVRDRRATLLQIDLGQALVVLSRARLGRDPAEVLGALEQLRSDLQR